MNEKSSQNEKTRAASDGPLFREWVPLTDLIERIPPKFHQGFVSRDLLLTCVTCTQDSLVAGSNAGILFWFDRGSDLVCKKTVDERYLPVTAVALSSKEKLAAGNQLGSVAVFSSDFSEVTPISLLYLEHSTPITSLCWDRDGIHLLSGDEQGHVLLSMFTDNKIQALRQVVHESSVIVQLRFSPNNSQILISSLKRVLVADMDKPKSVVQVGQKERKNPAPFGADFGTAENELVIYSSRPGLRLWVSNNTGAVSQTLIFKESVSKPQAKLILLSCHEEYLSSEPAFGPVFFMHKGLVVTYSSSSLFILSTECPPNGYGVSVLKSSRFAANRLRNVAVHHHEMFLILDGRMLVRVSDRPDRHAHYVHYVTSTSEKTTLKMMKPSLQSTISKLATKISDVEFNGTALSNALAPLFDVKSPKRAIAATSLPPLPPPAPPPLTPPPPATAPKITYEFLDVPVVETRSPSPSEVTEDIGSSEWASSNESPDHKDGNGEEELLYGSYVGSKRKLKLNRKSRVSQRMEDRGPKETMEETPEETLEVWSSPLTSPVASSDFLEELQRKEQLLATLLKLDQPLDDVTQPPEEMANEPEESVMIQQPSQQNGEYWRNSPEPSELSEVDDSSSDDERNQQRQQQLRDDGIYSKYVEDEDSTSTGVTLTLMKNPTNPQTDRASPMEPDRVLDDVVRNPHIPTLGYQARWMICPLAGTQKLASLSVCRSYVVAVDGNGCVFYQSTDSAFRWRNWLPVDVAANHICVSYSAKQLWRLFKGAVYQGVNINVNCPVAQRWNVMDCGVISVGIVQLHFIHGIEEYIWLLYNNGTLNCRPLSCGTASQDRQDLMLVDAPDQSRSICCHGNQVWLLLSNGELYQRRRISPETPQGVDWLRIKEHRDVISMALSPSNQIWILTRGKRLFYREANDPVWSEVVLPQDCHIVKSTSWTGFKVPSLFKRQNAEFWLAVAENRVFVGQSTSTNISIGEHLTGYAWNAVDWTVGCNINGVSGPIWRMLDASGVNNDSRRIIWLMDSKNRLYCYHQHQLEHISIPTDATVVQLSVTMSYLWLLTEDGQIYVRAGNSHPVGNGWVQLSTLQFQPTNCLCHVALGLEVAWACDQRGHVYYRCGENGPPTLMPPAWIQLDPIDIFFQKIYVGPFNYMVWALDVNNEVYTRESILPNFPIGSNWLKIQGVEAVQLCISECAVWALSTSGCIYRRGGISEHNRSGDVWHQIPGLFSSISVSVDDKLWALDAEGSIFQLSCSWPLKSVYNKCADAKNDSSQLEDGWVLL